MVKTYFCEQTLKHRVRAFMVETVILRREKSVVLLACVPVVTRVNE